METLDIASRLFLLGTVHRDPDGFGRAARFFRAANPDLILVELSPFARVFRRKHQPSIEKLLRSNLAEAADRRGISLEQAWTHPQISAIRKQIALPFEYRAALGHARRYLKRLLLVDYSAFSKRLTAAWPELIATDNLAVLLSLPSHVSLSASESYLLAARRIYQCNDSAIDAFYPRDKQSIALWQERERYMARQIVAALVVLRPAKAIYIGGWWHLTSAGSIRTLREILGIPLARCILLHA
jgi:pheromone shutdown protein TraB